MRKYFVICFIVYYLEFAVIFFRFVVTWVFSCGISLFLFIWGCPSSLVRWRIFLSYIC